MNAECGCFAKRFQMIMMIISFAQTITNSISGAGQQFLVLKTLYNIIGMKKLIEEKIKNIWWKNFF